MPKCYNAFCSAFESNEQNLQDRALNLPFFFRYEHITSLKNHLSLAQGKSLSYLFGATFAAVFVLIYRLREFPLSAVVNNFESSSQLKQALPLYYKICPFCLLLCELICVLLISGSGCGCGGSPCVMAASGG